MVGYWRASGRQSSSRRAPSSSVGSVSSRLIKGHGRVRAEGWNVFLARFLVDLDFAGGCTRTPDSLASAIRYSTSGRFERAGVLFGSGRRSRQRFFDQRRDDLDVADFDASGQLAAAAVNMLFSSCALSVPSSSGSSAERFDSHACRPARDPRRRHAAGNVTAVSLMLASALPVSSSVGSRVEACGTSTTTLQARRACWSRAVRPALRSRVERQPGAPRASPRAIRAPRPVRAWSAAATIRPAAMFRAYRSSAASGTAVPAAVPRFASGLRRRLVAPAAAEALPSRALLRGWRLRERRAVTTALITSASSEGVLESTSTA